MHAAYEHLAETIAQLVDTIDDRLDAHGADNLIYTHLTQLRLKLCALKRNLVIATRTPPDHTNPNTKN